MDIRKLNSILMRTVAVLLMLVLVTSGMVSGRFARYVTTAEYSDSARVAKFHIVNTADEIFNTVSVPALVTPGEITAEGISLQNHSEVAVEFVVTVDNVYENIPLTFKILDETEAVLAETADGENSLTFTGTVGPGQMDKEYKLYIGWHTGGAAALDYCGRVDLIRVTVNATQVD